MISSNVVSSDASSPRNRRDVALCAALLALLTGCSTYDSGIFIPRREVHEIRIGEGSEERTAAEVDARIVGILRPADDLGQRIHARLIVHNPTERELVLRTADCRATPSGVHAIAPANTLESLSVPALSKRTIDLLFPSDDLPSEALGEIELEWVLQIEGRFHRSHATFQRARRPPGYWGPSYWGPGYGIYPGWGWSYDPRDRPFDPFYGVDFVFHHHHH